MQPTPVTFIWRTDVHQSDASPASRTDDWPSTVEDKLRQINQMAAARNATLILDGGDLFHIKTPNRNSHERVGGIIKIHQEAPCPTAINVGNHDVKHGDIRYLKLSPLEVLFRSDSAMRCYDNHEIWIHSIAGSEEKPKVSAHRPLRTSINDLTVRIVGVPYHGVKYDHARFSDIQKGDEDHLVVCAHVLASKSGGAMFEGEDILSYKDVSRLLPEASAVCFGHWHKDQGITVLDNGCHVVNVGSLTRGSLSADEVERIPCAASVTLSKGGLIQCDKIPLAVRPSTDVFDLVKRSKAVSVETRSDKVSQKLSEVIRAVSTETLEDTVRALPAISDKVKERVIGFIEKATK